MAGVARVIAVIWFVDGWRSLSRILQTCPEALRLEGSPETRGVPSSGDGPSQNFKCSGGGIGRKIRPGRSTVSYFWFGRTRVCITPSSLHRRNIGYLGKEQQHAKEQSYHTFTLYLRPSFLFPSRNSHSGSHSRLFPFPTTFYGLSWGNSYFQAKDTRAPRTIVSLACSYSQVDMSR